MIMSRQESKLISSAKQKHLEVILTLPDHSEAQQNHCWLDRRHHQEKVTNGFVDFAVEIIGVTNVGDMKL